jgi:ubiquinone/menaquinone biosynthesis C-methylase UbiE
VFFTIFQIFLYAKIALDEFTRVVKNKGVILIGDIPKKAKNDMSIKPEIPQVDMKKIPFIFAP